MKTRTFTIATKLDMDKFITLVEDFPKYAWIRHDKDIDEQGEFIDSHIHAYLEVPNPRSFKSIADALQIPENMVLKVQNKNGILQYLTHKNQPDKHQYDISEIHANFDLEPFFEDTSKIWYDFMLLKSGLMTAHDFYLAHKSKIDSNSFYTKIRLFDLITSYQQPNENRTQK